MSLTERQTIPLAQPVIGREEEELVLEVLRSGRLSLGPRLPEFERAFAARVQAPYASAVSSGTAGLHLALRAVGVTEGDEVVTWWLVRGQRVNTGLQLLHQRLRRSQCGQSISELPPPDAV